jgi:Protein of unknown function (DUF3592)
VAGRIALCRATDTDCDTGVTACRECKVGYEFDVAGRTYHGRAQARYGTYSELENGAAIMVRYLPADPDTSDTTFDRGWVDGGGLGGMIFVAIFGLGLFGGLGVIGAVALVSEFRSARRAIWLRQHGVQRGAVVARIAQSATDDEGVPSLTLHWNDDTGTSGHSRSRKRTDLPQAGERITIYADPDGKLPPVWEGDSGTR